MLIKLATFTLISLITLQQDIEIRPKLAAGDKFRLDVARVRSDSSRPQMNATGRTPIHVEVISAGATGYVLDWIPGDTEFDNPQLAQDPTIAAVSEVAKGLRYRIGLNADGEFTGLLNEAEIRPKLQTMVAAITKEFSGRLPANQRKSFEDMMAQILSPAVVIASATRDAQIYLGLNGAALAPGETASANLEQANPFGGAPIPATFNVRMDSATATSASLTTTMNYDKNALTKMTVDLAQRAGAPVRPEELAKLPPMQMTDEGKYEFDRALGLMRKLTISRRVSVDKLERVDGWTITLVEAPKR